MTGDVELVGHRVAGVRESATHRTLDDLLDDPLDDSGDLIVLNGAWPARASLVQQTVQAILQKTPPPFAHCVFMATQFRRNLFARQAIRTAQDHPAAVR